MNKQSNQITEEQFREICMEAGVTTDELYVRNGQDVFTVEGIKKLRHYFITHGDLVRAWNSHKLLKRIKRKERKR